MNALPYKRYLERIYSSNNLVEIKALTQTQLKECINEEHRKALNTISKTDDINAIHFFICILTGRNAEAAKLYDHVLDKSFKSCTHTLIT